MEFPKKEGFENGKYLLSVVYDFIEIWTYSMAELDGLKKFCQNKYLKKIKQIS